MWKLEKIKSQVKEVISYSQNIDNPNVDELMDKWMQAKREFIEAMDGKLIYEHPEKMYFSLDEQTRESRIDYFIGTVEMRWNNCELAAFINDMRDGFFNNLTVRDYEYDGKLIRKGTKLVKAFKYFEKNKCALTDIQNAASKIIQEDKVEGRLCISVHPLDYLSVSENTYNWRSCHALDGEYRSGNLSYMVDQSTVVCYLKAEKDEVLPNFPFKWNSKKWRVLIYLSNDWHMIMAGRQYPFGTEAGLNFIKDTLLVESGISKGSSWSSWHDERLDELSFTNNNGIFYFNSTYIPVGGKLIELEKLVVDEPGSMQFNDLLKSSCYKPIFAYRIYNKRNYLSWNGPEFGETTANTRFHIGGAVPCTCCGNKPIALTESMRCIECEEEYGTLDTDEFGYCNCCGRHFYLEDAYYVNDEPICAQCYDTQTTRCERCGDLVYNENIAFDKQTEQYICSYCHDELYE
jgi:hypothetical protein